MHYNHHNHHNLIILIMHVCVDVSEAAVRLHTLPNQREHAGLEDVMMSLLFQI